jgi:hypothetical protein
MNHGTDLWRTSAESTSTFSPPAVSTRLFVLVAKKQLSFRLIKIHGDQLGKQQSGGITIADVLQTTQDSRSSSSFHNT